MNVCIQKDNGYQKINIDGKLYPPLSFKSFRPNPKNISEFYRAGVRLFSVLSSGITSFLGVPYSLFGESWIGDEQYDFSAIDRQMDMFIANAPDAYFAPMLQLDTRDWYLAQRPGTPNSFTNLSQIACDEEWKQAAANYLRAAITHCEEKYGDRIYGYFLLGGTTTEWFSRCDFEQSHPIKEAGYKKWSGDENAQLPTQAQLTRSGPVFLEEDEENVFRARQFHAEIIADLVLYFAREAQTVLQHKKLVGAYFGYLLELSGEQIYNDGSLGYAKVFESPDIDMISSPSSYGYRKIDDPSAFMLLQKSLFLHNKLYFLEFDHITHTAPEMIQDSIDENSPNKGLVKIPGAESKCKDETESLNLMYRDFMLCSANMTAMWWFDMFDGWFRSEGMMNAVRNMIDISRRLSSRSTHTAAEIAFFAEGEVMYKVRKSSNIPTFCLSNIRRTLAECGAPYDMYTIEDLQQIDPTPYKLFIFANQYEISPANKHYITEKLEQAGKTVLWLYAPGYIRGGLQSADHIRDLTGITADISSKSHGDLCWQKAQMSFDIAAPYFSINDPCATPLAYFEDGATAVASKKNGAGTSVYAAVCNLPSGLLREIAQQAGVHIYSPNEKVYTYVNSGIIGVYNATDSDAQIALKHDGIYTDLLQGGRYECQNGILTIPHRPFRCTLLCQNSLKEE